LRAARAGLGGLWSAIFGGALVPNEGSRRAQMAANLLDAAAIDSSFAFEGLLEPLILRTNCSDAARISSPLTRRIEVENESLCSCTSL
jgi:hypothetical protein